MLKWCHEYCECTIIVIKRQNLQQNGCDIYFHRYCDFHNPYAVTAVAPSCTSISRVNSDVVSDIYKLLSIVAYRLKAGISELERSSIARQRL
jgi:hypothetical protein